MKMMKRFPVSNSISFRRTKVGFVLFNLLENLEYFSNYDLYGEKTLQKFIFCNIKNKITTLK